MGIVILVAMLAYVLWIACGRNLYIVYKYGEETGIEFKYDLSREEQYAKLKNELTYPDLKEIFYDEKGRISLKCKYRSHSLRIENDRLYVCKQRPYTDKVIEEAECLKAYIEKLFNPDSPINPRAKYDAMSGHKKQYIILHIVIVAAFALGFIWVIHESGAENPISSKNISSSYLTEFSSTETVGEAFNGFFSNPKWKSYSVGAEDFVDFSGGCTYGDDYNANMVITFAIYDDYFEVEKIKVNGEELPAIQHYFILSTIYEE